MISENTLPLRESPPPIGVSQQNSSPVSMAMPHLPITATTKVAESPAFKGLESPGSPMQSAPSNVTETQPDSQSTSRDNQPQLESPIHAGIQSSHFADASIFFSSSNSGLFFQYLR